MKTNNFKFKNDADMDVHVYKWSPNNKMKIKGVLQIAHGMAEDAYRYERFAREITNAGYIVYANDHRGHGKTSKSIEEIGYLGKNSFNGMISDMTQLTQIIKSENEGLKIILMGHSMGSFLTQGYILEHSQNINAAILSGSCKNQKIMLKVGALISKREIKKYGDRHISKKMDKLSFGSFNNNFKPNRTDFDWLSSDEKEVDKYIDNPHCGAVFTSSFFYDFMTGISNLYDKQKLNKIPKNLPIYIFSGENDPVGKMGKGVIKLYKMYKKLGLENIKYKLYKNGRHEMLNEKNRDKVTKDIIDFLENISS